MKSKAAIGNHLAAVFGAIDDLAVPMRSRAFRLATWHAVLNRPRARLLLLHLPRPFSSTFIVRRRGGASQGPLWSCAFGLLLVGSALLAGTGRLGGKLAFEHRVGVVAEAPLPAPRCGVGRSRDPGGRWQARC